MTEPLPPTVRAILSRCDAGDYPDAIAAACDVSTRYVHRVLAEHRPERARKPYPKTGTLRLLILLRKAEGKRGGEIAKELAGRCSRAYVYATLNEES